MLSNIVAYEWPLNGTAHIAYETIDNHIHEMVVGRQGTWRDNDMKLHPLLQQSFLLHEVTPLSQDLSALGAAGLQALDYLDKSEPGPESWRAQQLALIERARTPRADLLLLVVAPVQQLIEASASQTQK